MSSWSAPLPRIWCWSRSSSGDSIAGWILVQKRRGLALMDVDAGRRAKRHEPARGRTHTRGRQSLLVALRLEPSHPSRPPRTIAGRGAGEPGVGIDVAFPALAGGHDVVASVMTWFRHDPGIVATIGEQEGQLVVGEEVDLVDRAPGRDVIGLGADDKHRSVDILSAITLPSTA